MTTQTITQEADYRESIKELDNICFCHLAEEQIFKTEMRVLLPILEWIGSEFNLDGDMGAIYDRLIIMVNQN